MWRAAVHGVSKESDSTERLNKNRSYHNPEAKLLLPKRVGSAYLLQGIFPTQGSNPGLPHFRRILHQLSHWGSPKAKQRKATVHKVPGLQTSPPRHSNENGVGDKKSPPEQATEFCSAQFPCGGLRGAPHIPARTTQAAATPLSLPTAAPPPQRSAGLKVKPRTWLRSGL